MTLTSALFNGVHAGGPRPQRHRATPMMTGDHAHDNRGPRRWWQTVGFCDTVDASRVVDRQDAEDLIRDAFSRSLKNKTWKQLLFQTLDRPFTNQLLIYISDRTHALWVWHSSAAHRLVFGFGALWVQPKGSADGHMFSLSARLLNKNPTLRFNSWFFKDHLQTRYR